MARRNEATLVLKHDRLGEYAAVAIHKGRADCSSGFGAKIRSANSERVLARGSRLYQSRSRIGV